ncbi:MAG: nucleoside deaminase [Bacilli bacterium]|nr:nucleoside deaminase [Bacilli bacterium]
MEQKVINILKKLVIKASNRNETPVAAVIVCENKIISKAFNQRNKSNSTLAHAEILAIQKANKKLKSWRLNECSIYITIKPCAMCEAVIKEARFKSVYYLLERVPEKKQYNKTVFQKLDNSAYDNDIQNYISIIEDFWKKRRK